ncbi:hypothetical protein BDV12DRAFT_11950 [Aspergillus spectabilis]
MISLFASNKTARSFAYHAFRRNPAEEGPVFFLQVSQTPELLEAVPGKLGAEVPTEAVKYDQVGEAAELIAGMKPESIVLVGFGAWAGRLRGWSRGSRDIRVLEASNDDCACWLGAEDE